ncbi:response regulator transcription factor [Burkholderia pyrrocinia]|uniref:response regulator transcription factor n=1 Tax=Burkholderia pyrrocinia TaxID=60550 RepID=UPI00104402F2|nr:response regulator transcription factor [Burkholderia pyrrocinia]TDA47462.1 response regulator transcription factor [Burkholderia pyrrocinia]
MSAVDENLSGDGSCNVRIALLDSHDVVRFGLQMRVAQEPSWVVSGAFRRADELLDALAHGMPVDLVIMNHMLDSNDGLDLVRSLRAHYPVIRILICSESERADTIGLLFRLGVNGFIGRTQSLNDHVEAARKVAAGNTYFSARVMSCPSDGAHSTAEPVPRRSSDVTAALVEHPDLTARERKVLEQCLMGFSVMQIAQRFERSCKTISSQKLSAYRKLGVRSDAELIAVLSNTERIG